MKQDFSYFQNTECEYFPCHENADRENFSCLFCYCPLYPLAERCGGNFRYTDAGVKDCSSCLFPHKKENFSAVTERLSEVLKSM